MHWTNWGFFGMHFFWWLFWILLVVGLVWFASSARRPEPRESPLETLQRRYARGEIDAAEYEERRARLAGGHRPP